METILVVDDEQKILELVEKYLKINGFAVLCTGSGKEGMRVFGESLASANPVSLVLLDLMLPDCSGETLCRQIRQVSNVPIIMITAKVDEESIIQGLNLGADDYVCKPFSPRQLMARVRAALRRTSAESVAGNNEKNRTFLAYKDLSIDPENHTARRNGTPLALTRDEYNILALLMSRQEKIFTREEILEAVKGGVYDGFDRSVDSHVKRLRAKIGDDPKTPRYIVTVYGMGYRLGGE